MTRFTIWLIGALMFGGIIHIGTVLALPHLAPQDAWKRMAEFGGDDRFNLLPAPTTATTLLPMIDPMLEQAACRFSLDTGPRIVENRMPMGFWSIGVFNQYGQALFSLNDRTAGGRDLKLIIASQEQVSQLREEPPEDLESTIIVETQQPQIFVILRAFVSDETKTPHVEAVLNEARCRILEY